MQLCHARCSRKEKTASLQSKNRTVSCLLFARDFVSVVRCVISVHTCTWRYCHYGCALVRVLSARRVFDCNYALLMPRYELARETVSWEFPKLRISLIWAWLSWGRKDVLVLPKRVGATHAWDKIFGSPCNFREAWCITAIKCLWDFYCWQFTRSATGR